MWQAKQVSWGICLGMLAALSSGKISGAEQAPAKGPAPGLRLYACDIHADEKEALPGDPVVNLSAPRNGASSGKVVLAAPGAVKGLKATVGVLTGPGTIPAARVQVRFAVEWDGWEGSGCPRGPDILLESPKAEFSGLVPIWVTVRVPKDAKPGAYTGQLKVELTGEKPLLAPVKLQVADWTLPESQDFRAWVELIQSPDTLAAEYQIPLWSEKHWTMIAQSLRYMGEVGSRVLYIPLIVGTNQGNEESMVRWIKKGDGYEQDFSIMDKYLDLAEKNMGKPKIVVLYAWDLFLGVKKGSGGPPPEVKGAPGSYDYNESKSAAEKAKLQDKGPRVTLLNPSTSKTEVLFLPKYDAPESKALWKPVYDAIFSRMEKRGLKNTLMLGVASDYQPPMESASFLAQVAPELYWAQCSHHNHWISEPDPAKKVFYGLAGVGYGALALDFQHTINPEHGHTYGWQKNRLHAQFWRFGWFNMATMSTVRQEEECQITGLQRGIGHLGADLWHCLKDKSGRRRLNVSDRYVESYWHSLNIHSYLLGPGPDGPQATRRYELFREGVQECEARIAIESALTDAAKKTKLGADLADRAQKLLDERQLALWKAKGMSDEDLKKWGLVTQYREFFFGFAKNMNAKTGLAWFIGSGWQDRTGKLYQMAGEVGRKLAP